MRKPFCLHHSIVQPRPFADRYRPPTGHHPATKIRGNRNRKLFNSCDVLKPYVAQLDDIFKDFTSYKVRVPVTGAIILDETFERCLLVKGWKGSSWSFPPGKKSKDEEDDACAIREKYFDIDLSDKAKCAKNSESRKKRKWNPKNGSVSNARHHVRVGKDLDAPTGQIETFRDQHYSDETGWVGEDLEEKYEQMMQLRDVYSVEEMTDYDIMEQVLGRESVRLKGWGRIPSESSGATDATSRPLERVPSVFEQQLLEKVALLEGALSGVKDTLQSQQTTLQTQQSILNAHDLIPPSSALDA